MNAKIKVTSRTGVCSRFLFMFLIGCIICHIAMSNFHCNCARQRQALRAAHLPGAALDTTRDVIYPRRSLMAPF